MAIEKTGPGGVGNAYGPRITRTPSASSQAGIPHTYYSEFSPNVSFATFYGTNVCVVGDSISQQNTNIIGVTANYLQRGPVSNMLALLGWPWEFQPQDNYAVFGSTIPAMIATQLPVLAAAQPFKKYSRCFLSCGTNDTNSGLYTLDQIKANALTLFNAIRSLGMIPAHTGVRPRGNDAATTVAKQMNSAFNEWLYSISLTGLIEFINVSEVYADNSTAFGNILPALSYDSVLHPNGRGAFLEGQAMANYYKAMGVIPQLKFAVTQNDVFDRVNNITGVAFKAPNPLLQGGTTAPVGMTTSGGTWSKVSRALPNGQTRSDPSCVLAASTTHFLSDDFTTTGNYAATELQAGDIVEARAKVTITTGVNIQNVNLLVSFNNGATSNANSCLATDSSSVPDGDTTLYLKTPRFTIQSYAGSGNVSFFARVSCITAAGGSGTFNVQAFELRKVG